MHGREFPAEVPLAIARELEARDHRVAEHPLDKDLVRQSAREVLEGGDYARVAYPQVLAVVVERVKKCLYALVHVVEAFACGEPEPAPVAFPCGHLGARNCGELLAFPGAEVYFHQAVVLLDGKPGGSRNLLGESHAPQERAAEKSGRVGACLQKVFDGAGGFFFECGGYVKVESPVADVFRVVGLGVSKSPEDHGGFVIPAQAGILVKKKCNPKVAKKNPRRPEHIKIHKSVAAFALASCPQIVIAQGLGTSNIENFLQRTRNLNAFFERNSPFC